jgi:uncharacterized protein
MTESTMTHSNPTNAELYALLSSVRTLAIVGASSNPERPSHGIMRKLQQEGYRTIPVNPHETTVLGETAYPSLLAVPLLVDIVVVFRRPEYTPAIADDAVAIKARALWMQSGIENEEAAAIAKAGGLTVVMDACIATVHVVLRVPAKVA